MSRKSVLGLVVGRTQTEPAPAPPTADWVAATLEGQPPLLKIDEAARLLRMTTRTIYRLAGAGKLILVAKNGERSRRVVPRASIEAYLRSLEGA